MYSRDQKSLCLAYIFKLVFIKKSSKGHIFMQTVINSPKLLNISSRLLLLYIIKYMKKKNLILNVPLRQPPFYTDPGTSRFQFVGWGWVDRGVGLEEGWVRGGVAGALWLRWPGLISRLVHTYTRKLKTLVNTVYTV